MRSLKYLFSEQNTYCRVSRAISKADIVMTSAVDPIMLCLLLPESKPKVTAWEAMVILKLLIVHQSAVWLLKEIALTAQTGRVHVSLFQRLGGNSKFKTHFWFLAVAFLPSLKPPVFSKNA